MRWFAALVLLLLAPNAARADEPASAAGDGYGASARVRKLPAQGVTTLDAESARARPAALGEPARALLDVAGVARSGFAGSELAVWGAAGDETRVFVDGIEIPQLFHTAGLRTTVHAALIDSVTLVPGAAEARYGRGLGGVVELSTKQPSGGLHAGAGADAIDASLSGQVSGQRAGALLGLRYGYLDRVVGALAPQTSEVLAVPAHADGALKLLLHTGERSELTFTWIGTHERVDVAEGERQERTSFGFHSFGLKLERRYRDGAQVNVTPFVGLAESRTHSEFGGLPLALSQRGVNFGLRAEYLRTRAWLGLSLGLDVQGSHDELARSGTLTLPAREGDVHIYGQAPVDAIAADQWRTTLINAAPYLALTVRIKDLSIQPALRLENMLVSASRALPTLPTVPATGVDRFYTFLEPRLRVSYRITRVVSAEARAGIYHQAPRSTDLSAVLGSPTLRPARAIHGTLGVVLTLPRAFAIDCLGYYRALDDLTVRSAHDPPELARALVSEGTGRSYGGSLALRGEPLAGLSLLANYTLGRSERSRADGGERLFDRDQTHLLNLILGYKARAWSSSAGLRAATGSPRTRVEDRYYDGTSGRAEPVFGVYNGARLPFYVQLNLHGEYHVLTAPVDIALLLDVLNLTNRHNVEQVGYDPSYSQRRDVTGIPLLAMLGVRVEY